MDYHFYSKNKVTEGGNSALKDFKDFFKFIKKIFPVLIIAAILPLFYSLVISPPNLKFMSQANQDLELNLWFEPANIVAKPGSEVEIKLVGLFENDTTSIPAIKVKVTADEGLILDKSEISRFDSFNGKVVLGTLNIKTSQNGNYKLVIPKGGVEIIGLDKPVKVLSSPLTITVR